MSELNLPHRHGEGQGTVFIQEQLNQTGYFQKVAEVFKQLGDTTRIRIFWLLCHCEECVINISALMEMSSPAVSHHLRPLKNSGLIVCRREGKEVYYRAADTEESCLLHQMIEQVMEITCPDRENCPDLIQTKPAQQGQQAALCPEQMEIVHKIHEQLMENMGQRATIEELSRQYLINPTTLKAAFKSVYGTSIAAHMKAHRMEEAARLLRESDDSIAKIAQLVGYDSQSKFTAAFKASFQVLPKEYRRNCRGNEEGGNP